MELGAVAAVLAALGGVLKLVLDHLRKSDEAHTAAIHTMQERQENFLSNHLSKNTNTIENLTVVSSELVKGVQKLHDDNIATAALLVRENIITAATLEDADEHVVRKVEEAGRNEPR